MSTRGVDPNPVEVVRFCRECSRAYDSIETVFRHTLLCDECRRANRLAKNRRYRERKRAQAA